MLSSLILTTALLVGAPAPPQPPGPPGPPGPSADMEIYRIIPLETIAGGMIGDFFPIGAPDGVQDAIIQMDHGGLILVSDFALFDIDTANRTLKIRMAAGEDEPAVFRTVYVDEDGRTHEVVTDCRKYSTFRRCAEQHGEALSALEAVFPPRKVVIQFNEINPRYQEAGENLVRGYNEADEGVTILPALVIQMINR